MKQKRFAYISFAGCLMTAFLLLLAGCTEQVDMSARYVFKEATIKDYLRKYPETYSTYLSLLEKVPVSMLSKTTVSQLLSARGNYTVFAPTNEAIQEYLDTLAASEREWYITSPSWDGFTDSTKLDSIRRVIVRNSVIDGGDKIENVFYTYFFPTTSNAEFILPNMNERKLTVEYHDKDQNDIYINGECPVDARNRDIPALNGVIHCVHKVIAPADATLADYLQEVLDKQMDGYLVMARAIQACGLLDTLRACRDEAYEWKYLRNELSQPYYAYPEVKGYMNVPPHRYIGFTIFAETDNFWRGQGIEPTDPDLLDKLMQWILDNRQYSDVGNPVADKNYKKENNLLNLWVTYHMLPFKLSAGKLSVHENEFGFSISSPYNITIPVMDYYASMGKRRLIKLIETKVSNGVCINRFPTVDNTPRGTGLEIGCDPDKEGILIEREDSLVVTTNVKNGSIFPVNRPIAYTDEVRNNLGKERIRFDVSSTFPELISNDIKLFGNACPGHTYALPYQNEYQYVESMDMNERTCFVYWSRYHELRGIKNDDEIIATGRFDVLFRLPPVPKKTTYEIRYNVYPTETRGIVQIYFGTERNHLHTPDIPQDLRKPISSYKGFESDSGDPDHDAEVTKALRNNGVMKGVRSVQFGGGTERESASGRRIIVRETMDPDKTYYIRFQSTLDSEAMELFMDYLEFCPKEVYDNPLVPEDVW